MTVFTGFPVIGPVMDADVSATVAEINAEADDSARYQAAGGTLTLTVAAHNKKVIKLDTAAGSVVTLPDATGSGARFRFVVTTIATSNSHIIKVSRAADTMCGVIVSRDDTSNNAVGFAAGATADTITLNRTTTGSVVIGEWLELEDIAANLWHVKGMVANTSTPASQFSATVS